MNTILEQIGSIVVMLLLFVLILYGSYYCSKKVAKMSVRENSSKYMKLNDRMMLGQDKYVAIVTVGERCFLIGTAGDGVSLLTELSPEDLKEVSGSQLTSGHDFKDLLKRLGKQKDLQDGDR